MRDCDHAFRPLTNSDLADEWMSVGAHCSICGHSYGWRCKESPDGVCHYPPEEGEPIDLLDGTALTMTEKQIDEAYYESCVFCGMPDERK